MKLAFADVYEYVSDADTMRVRNADLLDKEYLRSRARLIDMKKAKTPQHGVPGRGGTVYLTAADASGMMVSYIQSNYAGFGSGVVVGRHQHAEPRLRLRAATRTTPTSSRRASGRSTPSFPRSSRRTGSR